MVSELRGRTDLHLHERRPSFARQQHSVWRHDAKPRHHAEPLPEVGPEGTAQREVDGPRPVVAAKRQLNGVADSLEVGHRRGQVEGVADEADHPAVVAKPWDERKTQFGRGGEDALASLADDIGDRLADQHRPITGTDDAEPCLSGNHAGAAGTDDKGSNAVERDVPRNKPMPRACRRRQLGKHGRRLIRPGPVPHEERRIGRQQHPDLRQRDRLGIGHVRPRGRIKAHDRRVPQHLKRVGPALAAVVELDLPGRGRRQRNLLQVEEGRGHEPSRLTRSDPPGGIAEPRANRGQLRHRA